MSRLLKTSFRLLTLSISVWLLSWPGGLTAGSCGDRFCSYDELEDCYTCPQDCCPDCGDGWCSSEEACYTCPEDCGGICPEPEPKPSEVCYIISQTECEECVWCQGSEDSWCRDTCTGNPGPPPGCIFFSDAYQQYWICW
jgi:hypothetical protein